MWTRAWIALLFAFGTLACARANDPATVALRARLSQDQTLSRDEIARLYQAVAPVIAGKALSVRQGAITRTLDEKERIAVLGILSDPAAVYDGGVWTDGAHTWRGIKAGATPAHSEIDATETLWIDVDTFLPIRYDFEFSLPGFGDYSYDLTFQ